MKDTMSKLLMYDNDGDKLLVRNNKTIIKCAKSFQEKFGMIPNYYDMPNANPTVINNTSLYFTPNVSIAAGSNQVLFNCTYLTT